MTALATEFQLAVRRALPRPTQVEVGRPTRLLSEGAGHGNRLGRFGAACRFRPVRSKPHSLRAMNPASQVRWRCPDTGAESDTFGELVRVVRMSRGVSQTALATRLGVSQPVVSKWESGRCRPQPETVSRIAAALEVSFTMSAQRIAS